MKRARLLYSTAYACGLIAAAPYFAVKGLRQRKYMGSLRHRLWMPAREGLAGPPPRVWVHAVSVGEVKIARAFATALLDSGAARPPVLTVTTATGTRLALSDPRPFAAVLPFPLDFAFSVRRAFDLLRPDLLVLAETELWPNTLFTALDRNVPVLLANGKISLRSLNGYRRMSWLMGPALKAVRHFCVREEEDRRRLCLLGVPGESITVTGSIKYDIPNPEVDRGEWRERLGITPGARVLVAGSTLRGEEDALLAAFKPLRDEMPDLRLVLAPRHPERFEEAARAVGRAGLPCRRRSQGPAPATNGPDVMLLDTIGELYSVYSLAAAAFVGGSLFPGTGGHSPVEPAAFGVPVVYGPHMENFGDIAHALEREGASCRLQAPAELPEVLRRLLSDAEARAAMGRKGLAVCERNRGAAARTAAVARRFLSPLPPGGAS